MFLTQAGTIVQNAAKNNAPYLTGTLKKSITTDNTHIASGKVEVGSNLEYARIREYVNKRNPHTRFYFKRAIEENEDRLQDLLAKHIQ